MKNQTHNIISLSMILLTSILVGCSGFKSSQMEGASSGESSQSSKAPIELNLNITDGKTHSVALYLFDYDSSSREQRVEIFSADTGAILDSRSVSSFDGGQYLVYNIAGAVKIQITGMKGANAVVNGVFFGPAL